MDISLWCLMGCALLASIWVYGCSMSLEGDKKTSALMSAAICLMLFLFQFSIAAQGQEEGMNFFTPWTNLIESEKLGSAIFSTMICFGGVIALISWLLPDFLSLQEDVDNLDKEPK